jgi:hypothetical protein
LAASLQRQQELVAEGKAPTKSPEPISVTKVAHKASFNNIKEKWKSIADEAPSAPVSTDAAPKRRKLVTVKSMSNLNHRPAAISSPTAKR